MQDATQDVSPLNRTVPRYVSQRHGTALINALMRSGMVVVGDIRAQHTAKMALAKDDDPVQAFLANGANPAFSESVRIRYSLDTVENSPSLLSPTCQAVEG